MTAAGVASVLGVALLLGMAVPWMFVRALVPALETSENAAAVNFRGRRVFHGLGVVWLVWAGCAIVGGLAAANLLTASSLVVLTLGGALAVVCFALGVVDDAFGSRDARGFKGHLRAMARGQLTTGGLKLLGISAASLVVALILSGAAPWGAESAGPGANAVAQARSLGFAVLAGAAIALTSNLVNLTDLRPGRALKTYSLLAVLGSASAGLLFRVVQLDGVKGPLTLTQWVDFAALALFCLGPVVAVWRYDLGERGMLGDAGANPMGAVAGMLVVAGLPAWGLVAYLALVLALNLASERVSFSRVIEGNPVLARIDGIGRLKESGDIASGVKSSPESENVPE